uniref:Uncharacterized protein n=1 Tax=Anguilla anguilla TaxID=7936 RepID=A0A0E9X3B9_ANGAN
MQHCCDTDVSIVNSQVCLPFATTCCCYVDRDCSIPCMLAEQPALFPENLNTTAAQFKHSCRGTYSQPAS